MKRHPATIVIRHQKEKLSKCSLRGLERRSDMLVLSFPLEEVPAFGGRILLTLGAPPLSQADVDTGLLLLDGTWRYAERMSAALARPLQETIPRSIPLGFVTAYPRAQTDCPNPTRGLSSIEALYIAYRLLGRDPTGLLKDYYWAAGFLAANAERWASLGI
jgi:pre-rRNA-processing protein TSR3